MARPAGAVTEGAVGAGAGTIAFGWKGGIGTSSRVLPATLGGHTVGVLVQTNFGGVLQILGAPVGKELGQYAFKNDVDRERGDGSIMMVVATDAPLSDRNLERLAARAIMGLARTGSSASNGSGDYVIAFSTATGVRRVLSTSGANARPSITRSDGGADQRRDVGALPGGGRGDGGGDLQLALRGDDRQQQGTHGRGAAAGQGAGDSAEVRDRT